MDKIPIHLYKKFADLPLDMFDKMNYPIYVLDLEWKYLFVNKFMQKNLGVKGDGLVGKHMWTQFRELASDPSFQLLKQNTERGIPSNITTISPITSQRLNIFGQPLLDCFLFYTSILPNKEDLINELRGELHKR